MRIHVVVRAPRRFAEQLSRAGFNPQPRFRWKAPCEVVTRSRGRNRATQMHICSHATGLALKDCVQSATSTIDLSERAASIAAQRSSSKEVRMGEGGGDADVEEEEEELMWFKSTCRLKGLAG